LNIDESKQTELRLSNVSFDEQSYSGRRQLSKLQTNMRGHSLVVLAAPEEVDRPDRGRLGFQVSVPFSILVQNR
jgi:hypothetical protein